MKLFVRTRGLSRRDRVEEPMPLRRRKEKDVVGRRPEAGPGGQAHDLEQRVGLRQIDDPSDAHARRRQAAILPRFFKARCPRG